MPDIILDIYPSPSPFLNLLSANIYGIWTIAHNNLLLTLIQGMHLILSLRDISSIKCSILEQS